MASQVYDHLRVTYTQSGLCTLVGLIRFESEEWEQVRPDKYQFWIWEMAEKIQVKLECDDLKTCET